MKSVEQVPRYGVSYKSGRIHSHRLILTKAPIMPSLIISGSYLRIVVTVIRFSRCNSHWIILISMQMQIYSSIYNSVLNAFSYIFRLCKEMVKINTFIFSYDLTNVTLWSCSIIYILFEALYIINKSFSSWECQEIHLSSFIKKYGQGQTDIRKLVRLVVLISLIYIHNRVIISISYK